MKHFFFSVILMIFAGELFAHQQKESYTTVQFNQRTQKLEVMHRFYLHDAEHVLNMVSSSKVDLSLDPEGQAAFADYVQLAFDLKDASKNTLLLSYIGFEIDGKYLWIYQEADKRPPFKGFWVRMTALQDVWPSQINHINFEFNEQVNSVRLKHEDNWQFVSLE